MKLDIVSFKQAERLQLFDGFDCPVDFYWSDTKYLYHVNDAVDMHMSGDYDLIPAPTVALALKWFREKRGATYSISPTGGKWVWIWCHNFFGSCDTYDEAESAILDVAINRSPFGKLFWIEPIYPQNDQNIE